MHKIPFLLSLILLSTIGYADSLQEAAGQILEENQRFINTIERERDNFLSDLKNEQEKSLAKRNQLFQERNALQLTYQNMLDRESVMTEQQELLRQEMETLSTRARIVAAELGELLEHSVLGINQVETLDTLQGIASGKEGITLSELATVKTALETTLEASQSQQWLTIDGFNKPLLRLGAFALLDDSQRYGYYNNKLIALSPINSEYIDNSEWKIFAIDSDTISSPGTSNAAPAFKLLKSAGPLGIVIVALGILAMLLVTILLVYRRPDSLAARQHNTPLLLLGVVVASAPLLGILGTVTGLLSVFQQLQINGGGSINQVSRGMSEALATTTLGLLVAIPAMMILFWLQRDSKKKSER